VTAKKGNLIVFDWNGTMIADTSACLNAMNTVLKTLDKPTISRSHYQHHYTMPLANLYHALGIDSEILKAREHEIHPLWHATYGAANIRLRRGAKAMLTSLRLAKCDAIILSNYVVQRIDAQARRLGVREHFSHIIAFEVGDATFRKRGKGSRLQDYLKQRHITTGIIVGDSEEEIEIGREQGLTTVAITDGMCSKARLRAMKPDFLIRSLSQVPAIAHRIFGTAVTS
jgi:phosphoglycolate phosphatase